MKQEKRVVQMDDGRTVAFGKVEKVSKEILKDGEGRPTGIRFDGDNGDTFVALFADLPDAAWVQLAEAVGISLWAMAHGYSQKLGDSYASLGNAGDCLEAVRAVWARLTKGQWQSDTRGFGGSSILIEALLLAYPSKTRDEIRAIVGELTGAERLALQIDPDVKPHFDQLQAAKAAGDVGALKARFQ